MFNRGVVCGAVLAAGALAAVIGDLSAKWTR